MYETFNEEKNKDLRKEMGQRLSNLLFRNRRQQITYLQRQLTEKDRVITSLRNQSEVDVLRIIDLQSQVTELENHLRDLQEQIEAIVTEHETSQVAKEQQISDLQIQATAKDLQVADLQEQVTERDDQVTDLQGRLTARDRRVTDLDRQLRERDQQATVLQRQLTERDQQVADLQRQLGTMRDQSRTCENRQEIQRDWAINRNEIRLMVDELLGEGAWGRVVRGKFRRCNIAVKQIYEALLSAHTRTILVREVGIASRCRHPCLLQFIGATRDERPLIVTELMDRSLRSLYEERPLTEREISVIALDVAQALNYLHQIKPDPIIHRDISSTNVLLWRQGDQWRGKVSDYGTANFVRQCTRDDPGAVIYCAPEALGGAQDPSCKVSLAYCR